MKDSMCEGCAECYEASLEVHGPYYPRRLKLTQAHKAFIFVTELMGNEHRPRRERSSGSNEPKEDAIEFVRVGQRRRFGRFQHSSKKMSSSNS